MASQYIIKFKKFFDIIFLSKKYGFFQQEILITRWRN